MTTPTVSSLATVYRTRLRGMTDAELAVQAGKAAALPGALAGEMRRLVDAERDRRAAEPATQPRRILRVTAANLPLRTLFPTPPDLRLDDVGGVCPIDDTVLVRTRRPAGLACPRCLAAWPLSGLDGRWVDAVPGRNTAVAGALLAGSAAVHRVVRWVDRRGAAELVADEDLDADALALLNRVRKQRGEVV